MANLSDTNFNALTVSARHTQAVKYVTVVSLALLVYDYSLTLDREIRLVWRSNWGIAKIVFLLTRYPTFIDVPLTLWHTLAGYRSAAPSPKKCLTVYALTTWFTVFGIAMAEGMLFLRTYALYHRNKKMLAFLVSFFAVMLVTDVVIAHLFVRSLRFGEAPPGIRELGGCYAVEGSKIIFIDFCTLIFQETIILSLTLYKAIRMARRSSSRLMKNFYQDGIFYYIYIFLISAGNIIVLVTGPVNLLDLLNTLQRVMHSLLATRIFLHVREALQKDMGNTTLTDLEFAHGSNGTSTGRSANTGQSTIPSMFDNDS